MNDPLWEHIRTWQQGDYRLELYDTHRPDRRGNGRTYLAYLFFDRGRLVFAGDDFGPSPLHADDSDASVAALLSFLSLKPGDTDREYFADYAPSQLEWAQAHGEELSLYAHDLENPSEVNADD